METRSRSPRARSNCDHRVGHLGKIRAGCAAGRSPSPWCGGDVPIDVLFERIQQRSMESPPIQLDDLFKWAEMLERPSPEEMALFDAPST